MFDDDIHFGSPAVDPLPCATGQDGDQLESWIRSALWSATHRDHGKLPGAAAACHEIYAAYNQVQREQQWYRQACAAAMERETKLRKALVALLESLGAENGAINACATSDEPALGDARVTPSSACEVGAQEDTDRSQPQTCGVLLNASGEAAPCPPHGDLDWWLPAQPGTPGLAVYLLRPFSVFVDDRPVSGLANRRSNSVLTYLLLNRQRPVAREVLWNTFWPDAPQEAARNNLNVAVCALRNNLANGGTTISHIIYCNGQYRISEELGVWVDVEAFDRHLESGLNLERSGDLHAAAAQFRAAAALYHSDLLDEDRYEDWLTPLRQRYRDRHLDLLRRLSQLYFDEGDYGSCSAIGSQLLAFEPCDEEAHRILMRCHARMRHIHLALRQFHICVGVLSEQLNVAPSVQTVEVFRQIKLRQPV